MCFNYTVYFKKTTIKLHNTLALPVLLYGSETWTVTARDGRRITAAEMKYMRITAGYTLDRLQNSNKITQYTGPHSFVIWQRNLDC